MKLKRILKFAIFAASAGLIFGLVRAVQVISSHQYLGYGLYRLTFHELARRANNGVFYALILGIFLFLVSKSFSLLSRKLLSPFFEVRIIRKDKLAPLFKGSILLAVFAYLVFQIIKFIQSPNQKTSYFLGQSLVVILAFYLISQYEKINRQLQKSGILSFLKSSAMKIWWGTIIIVFCAINILSLSQKLFFRPPGPNVLLIVADALRPDHLGCYGYNRPTSPNIDKFAADALVFENAFSNASWTLPSMGTIFTSLYPYQHHALYWTDNLPRRCLTLAEVFRNKNYATFAIQTNPSVTKNHNFHQGFERYEEIEQEKAETVTAKFLGWVKNHQKKPFFAYLHFMDTHVPYSAPQEFSQIFGLKNDTLLKKGRFKTFDIRILSEIGLSAEEKVHLISLYNGAVKYFDNNFERIVDYFKKIDMLNKTIIILTSDHGEEFWEHDGFAHGHSLYNEVLRVPLIIRYPPRLPAKRANSRCQLLDIFPTVLNIARIPNGYELRGNDLTSLISNQQQDSETVFAEGILFGSEKRGIIKDTWKLIEDTGKRDEDTFEILGDITKYRAKDEQESKLYNIAEDFREKFNLIEKHPRIANHLKKLIVAIMTSDADVSAEKKTKLKEKLEDMRSLGYIR